MLAHPLASVTFTDVLALAVRHPFAAAALAVLAAGVVIALRPPRPGIAVPGAAAARARQRARPERVLLRVGAASVIVIFIIEYVVRGYLMHTADIVSWWRFAVPIMTAILVTVAFGVLVATRGTVPPLSPVTAALRRSWSSFGPRRMLIVGAVSWAALVVTTVLAGLASEADDSGRYIWLALPVPNEPGIDPVRPWFYGWAYGLAVLVSACLLVAACAWALRTNAMRPFIEPATVPAERASRRDNALGIVQIATGAVLLTLGEAWHMIADAGGIQRVSIEGQGSYEVTWRYGGWADAAGWCAPLVEVVAFTLLILVVAGRRERTTAPTAPTPEAVVR